MESAVGEFAAIEQVIPRNDRPMILSCHGLWQSEATSAPLTYRCEAGRKLLWFHALEIAGRRTLQSVSCCPDWL